MSIFGRLNNDSTYNFPVVEGYGCEDLGDMFINTEAYDDMTDIIKSIHALDTLEIQGKREIAKLEESGAASYIIQESIDKYEVTYEAWYGDAWAKIKKFFVDLGKKIKAFFDSIVRWFASYYMTAKKYADKYGKQVIALETNGKLKGYKIKTFDNESLLDSKDRNVETIFNKVYDFANTKVNFDHSEADQKKLAEGKDELDKEIRGMLLGGNAKLTKENYTDELYALFRGSNAKSTEDKKETELSASKVVAFLKKDDGLKAAKKASDNMGAAFSKEISAIEKLAGHLGDKDKEGKEEYDSGRLNDKGEIEKKREWEHKKDYSVRGTTNLEGEETPAKADNRAGYIEAARLHVHIFNTGKTEALAYVNAWKNAIEEKISDYMKFCRGAFGYKESKD